MSQREMCACPSPTLTRSWEPVVPGLIRLIEECLACHVRREQLARPLTDDPAAALRRRIERSP